MATEHTFDDTFRAALALHLKNIGEDEIKKALANIEVALRKAVAQAAITISRHSNIEKLRDELVIRVKFDGSIPGAAPCGSTHSN